MKTLVIIIAVLIVIVLLVLFTPVGQKILAKARGQEIDSSKPTFTGVTPPPIKIKIPTLSIPVIPTVPTGDIATPEKAEQMLRALISKVYAQVTVMKTPYGNITDEKIKRRALNSGRTYKEELTDLVIRDIWKNTYPFGNIEGTSIPPTIWNKYIQPPRNPQSCRPGMNIEQMKSSGEYKHFTVTTGKCKVHPLIASIWNG